MGTSIIVPLVNMDYQLPVKYELLDRNEDGRISDSEELTWNNEDKRVNQLFFVDGARNVFGYVVLPIFGFIYSAIIFIALYTGHWLSDRFKHR